MIMLESDGNLRLASANHFVTSANPTPKFCKQQKELHWIQMLNLNWIQFILILCCSFSLYFFLHFSYLLFLVMFLCLLIFLLILRPTSFSYYHDLILLLLLLFHSGFCFWLFSFWFSFPHPFSCCTRADADHWIDSITEKFIRLRVSAIARQRTTKMCRIEQILTLNHSAIALYRTDSSMGSYHRHK